MELGRADVALDVLAKRGDWDRLWEVATKEKMATAVVSKFIIMRVEEVCVCVCMCECMCMCMCMCVCVCVCVCMLPYINVVHISI